MTNRTCQQRTSTRRHRHNGEGQPKILGKGTPGDLPLTDTGLAERFARQHSESVRYSHPWGKWFCWDGTRWKIDDEGHLQQLAKQTARSVLKEAEAETNPDRFKHLLKFAASAESAYRRRAMLQLAQSESPIPVLPDALNGNPWLLNCPNGTLDLQSGKLRGHDRGDLITQLCPTPYRPKAKAPRWEQFLNEIFAGSSRLADFMQRLVGYCLTGVVRDHILPILHGSGDNGKTTSLTALRDTLGDDYTADAPSDLLMLKHGEQHPTALSLLFGKRLVVAIETEQSRRLAESLVKQLTGGDRITCRRMREDYWEFRPTHKLLLGCNHKPRIIGTDWAIWRRIRLIPFDVTIPKDQQDSDLGEKLAAEAPGILAWAVRGCRAWQQHGLDEAQEVRDATRDYRSTEDSLAGFLNEVCELEEYGTVRASDLLKTYREWSGDKRLSQRRFGEMLSERGFERFTSNGVWYRGLNLPAEP